MIGLNQEKTTALADELNTLLASFQVYYQNLRGFHWNVKGRDFFQLHEKFEELYTVAQERIDEIAERILTLGTTPLHDYASYLATTKVKPAQNLADGADMVNSTREALKTLIALEREAVKTAGELDDEGSLTLLTEMITAQEKVVWMLSAWLNKA